MGKGNKSIYGLTMFTTALLMLVPFSNATSVLADESIDDVINEHYRDELSLQPVAPAFDVDSLLEWSAGDNPDSELNQSTVPLNKERFQGHQINPLANPDVNITSAAITLPDHDSSSSVGSNDFNVYAFDNWQLLDSYIYWPGAANEEGVFAFPSPDIVDAAHLNGVPVYASIGFPWGPGSPETLAEIEAFTQQSADGSFPVADKMIEMAEYYGFDGYFFNQETSGVSKETAVRMNDMMRYIKTKSDLHINWYDSQSNNGTISYQNAVNDKNDMYVKRNEDGAYAVDEFFLNYNWNVNKIDTTVSTMKKHKHSPYNAYAGFELQQNSYNTQINTDALLDEQDHSKVSIALYTPNSTMGLADDSADFHNEENKLWTGPQGDPSKANDSEDWKGMARFATDSSVIQSTPFTSNFNSGHGKDYYANGDKVSTQEWNNRSLQDIMPTWRWWIRGEGSQLEAVYDFEKAFNGGNSLKFTNDLDANSENEIMLYSTKLAVEDSTKVRLVYNNKPGADVSLGVAYSEDYAQEDMTYYSLPDSDQQWETVELDLSEDAGKTAYAFSLKVTNSDAVDNYHLNLGQLSVYDEQGEDIPELENVKVDEKMLKTSTEAEARLSWISREDVLHYEVYQENGQGAPELLGVTPNDHFYTPNISRDKTNASNDNKTTLKVVPVNHNYERQAATKVDFDWGVDPDATEAKQNAPSSNLALDSTITDVSFENNAEPASKALDGSSTTKWAATNKHSGHLTIDLGKEQTVRRWRVEHAEAGGEAGDMNTIDFELLYKNDKGEWVSAKRITDNHEAVTDIVLKEPVTASEFKLQVHNSGSSPWAAVRIYEWQLFESEKLPKTDNVMMHFATAENNDSAQDKVVIGNIQANQIVRLYDNLDSEKATVEKTAEKDGSITFDDLDFGEKTGRIYYTVQTPDVDESLKYSVGYLSETLTVADLQLAIQFLDLQGGLSDGDVLHALKMHLNAVEHFANQGLNQKVEKHLKGLKVLITQKANQNLITQEGAASLKASIDTVIHNNK